MATLIGTLGKRSVLSVVDGVDFQRNTLWGDTDGALPQGKVKKGGNDSLTGQSGGSEVFNTLYGDANQLSGDARGGNDSLIGGAGGGAS